MEETINFDISQVSKSLADLIDKFKKIAKTKDDAFDEQPIVKLSKNINDLTKDLQELERKRNASLNPNEIKKFNAEIEKLNKQIKDTKFPDSKEGGLSSFSNILKGGVILGVAKQVFDLGKAFIDLTDEVNKSRNTMRQFSKLSGDALDSATAQAQSLAKSFGKDFNEVLRASNALSKTMGISFEESLSLIEKGFIKGADANGEFLDSVSEYAIQFKEAGYSAEEFIKVATQNVTGGVFSDKLLDAVKELGLSLRELPKASQDALKNAFGADFTNALVRDLDKGVISSQQGLKRIQDEAKRTGLSVSQMQTLIADVFKGAGEDVGGLTEVFKQLDEAEKINLDNLSEAEKATKKAIQANKEYEEALLELSKNFEGWGKGISTFFTNLMTQLIRVTAKIFKINTSIKDDQTQLAKDIENLTGQQVDKQIKENERLLEAQENILGAYKRRLLKANAEGDEDEEAFFKKQVERVEAEKLLLNSNLESLHAKQLALKREFRDKDKKETTDGNALIIEEDKKAGEEKAKQRAKQIEDDKKREKDFVDFLLELELKKNEDLETLSQDKALKETEKAIAAFASRKALIEEQERQLKDELAQADEEKVNNTNEFYAKVLEAQTNYRNELIANDLAILEGAANFTQSLTALFGESVGQFGQLFQDVANIFSAYQKLQDVQRAKDSIEAASNLSVGVSKAAKLGFPQAIPAIFGLLAAVASAFGTVKRIAKFNEGTRHVEGGGNTDTVPALLTAGEAVITQSENKKLKPVFSALDNGMITHQQLVDFSKGKLKSGVVEKSVSRETLINSMDEKTLQLAFEKAIKKLPVNKFSFDEKGFNRSVINGMSEINYLNKVMK